MAPELLNLITAITSIIGLLLVIVGWIVASHIAAAQARKQTQIATDYEIYKNVLSQVNDIIRKISIFTTGIDSHTSKMAAILNETHAGTQPTHQRLGELINQWTEQTTSLVLSGYTIQESIIEFMRSLDMSGTNFHEGTRVYKALQIMQRDSFESIQSIARKWSNLDLVNTTVPQYDDLKADTQRDRNHVNELGACIEDVLKLIFNDTMVKNGDKKPKIIDLSELRKIITIEGLVDNRLGGNQ